MDEPIPRADPLSLRKLYGEGNLSESKTILGWDVNTRTMRIHLPKLKSQEWSLDIKHLIDQTGTVTSKVLERTIGRLNHAGYIIPHSRYFLNRIRYHLKMALRFGPIQYEEPNIKLHKTKKLGVPITPKTTYVDGYIDDLISICLDVPHMR